jgi:hypothetical protein
MPTWRAQSSRPLPIPDEAESQLSFVIGEREAFREASPGGLGLVRHPSGPIAKLAAGKVRHGRSAVAGNRTRFNCRHDRILDVRIGQVSESASPAPRLQGSTSSETPAPQDVQVPSLHCLRSIRGAEEVHCPILPQNRRQLAQRTVIPAPQPIRWLVRPASGGHRTLAPTDEDPYTPDPVHCMAL